ncbi:MAG: phosphoglucosamine mutase [Gammaproteobacteria bacterium]|nr:phosphoglucosamine mutase [Gammaproteobacteria bacterium]
MSNRQYFGTDGVRGEVGTHPMTPDFALKLGWAAGTVLLRDGGREVLLGKDTRLSGYMFEAALEAGFAAAGATVRFLGPIPTPAVAYLTRTFRAAAGVVISASHNPYTDNGFKFFTPEGFKLTDQQEAEIEALLDEPLKITNTNAIGRASRVDDALGRYIEYIKASVPMEVRFSGMKIALDCANGAGYKLAPQALKELGADVVTLGVEPNGLNINEGVGATSLDALQALVVQEGCDLGIALDGDADRVMLVDHRGNVVDGDGVLYLLASNRVKRGLPLKGVVGTLMTNLGLQAALRDQFGLPMLRADVGDRYVIEQMRKHEWELGGESSGHIILSDRSTTGDGLLAAVQVLVTLCREEKTLAEAMENYRAFPQILKNVVVKDKSVIMSDEHLLAFVDQAKAYLGNSGRVLLRPSGTEPKIRVMVEADRQELAVEWCDKIIDEVKSRV